MNIGNFNTGNYNSCVSSTIISDEAKMNNLQKELRKLSYESLNELINLNLQELYSVVTDAILDKNHGSIEEIQKLIKGYNGAK